MGVSDQPAPNHSAPDRPAHHDPALLGAVFIGGTLGTLTRAALENAAPAAQGHWPWATFCINIIGAFILSVLLQALLRRGPDTGPRKLARLAGGTGFLGGFTTYSTFAVETLHLPVPLAVLYAVATVVLGILAASTGLILAQRAIPAGGSE